MYKYGFHMNATRLNAGNSFCWAKVISSIVEEKRDLNVTAAN